MLDTIPANLSAPKPGLSLGIEFLQPDLFAVERTLESTLSNYKQRFPNLFRRLRAYQGKRLRPMLLLLTARACGTVRPAHHTLAAVVEMIHTATLVHDDILDGAETRRHTRTIHADFGNQTAILLGDLLFTTAFHLSSTVGDVRACAWIGEATNRVCLGELAQTMRQGDINLSEDDYFEILDGKTAALTECACRIGAVYSGADNQTIEHLSEYGRCLGIAFQIADDLLDICGDADTTGKTLGTDLDQLKLTLPLIHFLQTIDPQEAEEWKTRLTQGLIANEADFVDALSQAGSIAYAEKTARQLVESAIQHLECLPPSEAKTTLTRLARWSIQRQA